MMSILLFPFFKYPCAHRLQRYLDLMLNSCDKTWVDLKTILNDRLHHWVENGALMCHFKVDIMLNQCPYPKFLYCCCVLY